LVEGDKGGGAAVQAGVAIEIGGAEFEAGDVCQAQDAAVLVRADDYFWGWRR
jgi:hypothetical protein